MQPGYRFQRIWVINRNHNASYWLIMSCRQRKALLQPVRRIHHQARIRLLKISNLLATVGAIMIFMPKTIHWRTKKANTKHHWHHTAHDGCKTGFWLDFGDSRTTTVKAIKRGRSISVDSLLNGYSFRVTNDGVWRNGTGLIRVLSDVVLLVHLLGLGVVLGHWCLAVLVGSVVGNSDRWLLVLRHLYSCFPTQNTAEFFLRS